MSGGHGFLAVWHDHANPALVRVYIRSPMTIRSHQSWLPRFMARADKGGAPSAACAARPEPDRSAQRHFVILNFCCMTYWEPAVLSTIEVSV
jgi:hypothetical protein